MLIKNLTQNTLLASNASLADSFISRMKGLLGRECLPEGEALIITYCQSIHMVFMRFAIDVIFMDKSNRVIGLCSNIKPYRFSPIFWASCCAIELPAGSIKKTNTALGDQIQM